MKIAVIDIGSNSIRYMEAERKDNEYRFSEKTVYTTRLASGLIETGALSDASMDASIEVLAQLAAKAAENHLPCYCYATSAVRDANNRDVFLNRLRKAAALHVDILSGEREAQYARIGAGVSYGGLIDIGGGSSQIVTAHYRSSFPIGCVRVRDICGQLPLKEMKKTLLPVFSSNYTLPNFPPMDWVAVGGTATTLAALSLGLSKYDPKAIEKAVLTRSALPELLEKLDAMGDPARAAHPLLVKRHDVICGGGLILHYLMEKIGIRAIRFSDADGLEGYAIHLLNNMQE